MDLQADAFYRRVREGYEALVRAEPERWVVIAADRPADAIQADVRRVVAGRAGVALRS